MLTRTIPKGLSGFSFDLGDGRVGRVEVQRNGNKVFVRLDFPQSVRIDRDEDFSGSLVGTIWEGSPDQ